jgi:peroxiredoxin
MRCLDPRCPGLSILTLLALLVGGQSVHAETAPSRAKLGDKIADVAFRDAAGQPIRLYDFKDKKATVVVFVSFECPVSTSYAPILADLAQAYGPRGVAFLAVCPNVEETADQLARYARDYRIPFPVLLDARQAAAKALAAEFTPEAFVLDGNFVLRYRGRIDNSYAARLKKNPQVNRYDLRQALDEVLAGKAVSEPATLAIGCPIQRAEPTRSGGAVTFYRDVLPILQDRCQQCHRPGEVAPFSLMTYRQAVNWAADIKEYTQNHKMPPWKPIQGGPFHGERKLTDMELATLAAWVDGGTAEGDRRDAPAPRTFTENWTLGQPDLVLTMSDDFHLGPAGLDLYQHFILPTNLGEDKYVSAVEVRPDNRRVVHHAILFVDGQKRARRLEQYYRQKSSATAAGDHGPGFSVAMGLGFLPGFLPDGGLGGWAPGMMPHRLPEGVGFFLPKGADVILQLHYHRNGRAESDRTSVGLYFSKQGKNRRLQGVPVPAHFVSVPAGTSRYPVQGDIVVRQDCRLHSIMPHMHLLGREIKVTMQPPDGPPRTLVGVNDWDFNWQEIYDFREAIPVKAGTRFHVEGTFDNSAANPSNPNQPPKTVYLGVETNNEMCVGFLGMTPDQPGRIRFDIQVPFPGLKRVQPLGLPGIGF